MGWVKEVVGVVSATGVALAMVVVGLGGPDPSSNLLPTADPSLVAASTGLAAPSVTPRNPRAGAVIRLSGAVPRRWRADVRQARVQRQVANRWNTVATVKVHRATWRHARKAPAGTSRWRVVLLAPKRRVISKVRVVRASPAPRPTPTDRPTTTPVDRVVTTLTLAQPDAEIFGLPHTLTGTVTGGNRAVTVESRAGSDPDAPWVVLGTTTSVNGTWSLETTPSTTGSRRLRARTASTASATEAQSPVVDLSLRALRGTIEMNTIGPDRLLWITVRSNDPVQGVRLLVDGRAEMGTFHDTANNSWWAVYNTASWAPGPHRVTAQLRNGEARGLVTSAEFATAALDQSPDWLTRTTVAAGFDWPTTFALVGDTEVLVAEKAGKVWWVNNGIKAAEPVIDLTGAVATGQDRGLVGLALHPDFNTATRTGWVYLAYTVNPPGSPSGTGIDPATQVVSRIRLVDGARVGAEQVVLGSLDLADCPADTPQTPDCLPSFSSGHTVDDLLFAPDGSLFVSVGDGVIYLGHNRENWRAQSLDVLAGKVLRIDPETGLGLPDNPFHTGTAQASDRNRNRVWAYGLRNPFRMSLTPEGRLVVGDVGSAAVEEVSVVSPGENHGWPCYEGSSKVFENDPREGCEAMWAEVAAGTDDLAWPVHEYPHAKGLGSVTVGGVLDDSWPTGLAGRVLVADYNHEWINAIDLEAPAGANADPQVLLTGGPAGTPVKFAEASDGSQWYLSIGDGELRRLSPSVPAGLNTCPTGRFESSWYAGTSAVGSPVAVTCETTANTALVPEGLPAGPLTVRWRAEPRTTSGPLRLYGNLANPVEVSVNGAPLVVPAGPATSATQFVAAGVTHLEATATVNGGEVLSWSYDQPGTAPQVRVDLAGGAWVDPGADVPWTVGATDQDDRDVSGTAHLLVELLHHGDGDFHAHQEVTAAGDAGVLNLSPAHAPGQTVFRVTATATDAEGRVGVSDPVFVCLTGNRVGVCS